MYYAPALVDLLEEIVARPNSVDGAAAVRCALSLFGTAGLVLFGVVWTPSWFARGPRERARGRRESQRYEFGRARKLAQT